MFNGTAIARVPIPADTVLTLIARIEELEAANQKLQDGLDFTGEIIKYHCVTLTEATHSQDLLWGTKGDGDYDSMWGRVYDNYEAAQQVPSLEATIQRVRELHTPEYVHDTPLCTECSDCETDGHPAGELTEYPCPTIQALGDTK